LIWQYHIQPSTLTVPAKSGILVNQNALMFGEGKFYDAAMSANPGPHELIKLKKTLVRHRQNLSAQRVSCMYCTDHVRLNATL
jgi:hypothetical protein